MLRGFRQVDFEMDSSLQHNLGARTNPQEPRCGRSAIHTLKPTKPRTAQHTFTRDILAGIVRAWYVEPVVVLRTGDLRTGIQ